MTFEEKVEPLHKRREALIAEGKEENKPLIRALERQIMAEWHKEQEEE